MTTENTTTPVTTIPVASDVNVEVIRGSVIIDSITKSQFQKEKTMTALLRQTVKTIFTYPEAQVKNNKQDNLFDVADFGFGNKTIESVEQRVGFIDVPEATTVEQVAEMLTKTPGACLYRELSNSPILTDAQIRAIANNIQENLYEKIANAQAVRHSENAKDKDGNNVGGQLILDKNNKIQYRAVFFKTVSTPDIDNRTVGIHDFYITPLLKAELFGAENVPTQSL